MTLGIKNKYLSKNQIIFITGIFFYDFSQRPITRRFVKATFDEGANKKIYKRTLFTLPGEKKNVLFTEIKKVIV